MSRPTILLFGIGSIGSVYAALLGLSGGCDVYLVARSNYDILKTQGLEFNSEKFGNHRVRFQGVYRTCEDAAASGQQFDYIICANKALLDAHPSLPDQLRPTVSPRTTIVLFQNGVGGEEPLHTAFPSTPVLSACVWTGGRVPSPGVVEQFNTEGLTIGCDYTEGVGRDVQERALEVFVGVLRGAGSEVVVSGDIQSERWVKVIWNACWNAVTTATQLRTNRFLASTPHSHTLARSIMAEVAAVARAKGLSVPRGTEEALMRKCMGVEGGLPSSMLFDYMAGRAMEVEVILGTPLREGLRLGVPVPSLTAMYSIVKALDWKNAHPEEAKV